MFSSPGSFSAPPKAIKNSKIDLDTDEGLKQFVEDTYQQVEMQRVQRMRITLEEALDAWRNQVLDRGLADPTLPSQDPNYYPRLPSIADPPLPLAAALCCQPTTCDPSTTAAKDDTSSCDSSTTSSLAAERETLKNKQAEPPVTVRMRSAKGKMWTESLPAAIPLEGTHEPLPRSSAAIFLKTHYATEDEKKLAYVPYFGEDDNDEDVLDLYDTEEREKQMEFGPECQERDMNDAIDETLTLIQERLREQDIVEDWPTPVAGKAGKRSSVRSKLQNRIHAAFADILGEKAPVDRIHDRYRELVEKAQAKDDDEPPPARPSHEDGDTYMMLMDSFRPLFCRRCFTYDCNIHGGLDKPDVDLQTELAVQKEREGFWEAESHDPLNPNERAEAAAKSPGLAKKENEEAQGTDEQRQRLKRKVAESLEDIAADKASMTEMTRKQKILCERAFVMFQGDVDQMAVFLGVPRLLVANHVKEKDMKLKEFEHVVGITDKKKRNLDHSMKNYNPLWLRNVQGAEIHPFFHPCDHVGLCSEENCSCVKMARFCTKHCVWGRQGLNFYRGCACKGTCCYKTCSCFAAKRECDPDLCRTCGACTDAPNKPATEQRCRNDNIGMRRHAHFLLGKSSIEDAGWGIYTKGALKKGDFVHEYVGELISQEEAERRGRIYDKVNRSYLFNLCSDIVVDASRFGNKTRFANHHQKPNCETRIISVNGDNRIGLFAIQDIEPQSELFFDYRYDASMDNDLIVKAGMTVDWQKDPKMANTIKKKYA